MKIDLITFKNSISKTTMSDPLETIDNSLKVSIHALSKTNWAEEIEKMQINHLSTTTISDNSSLSLKDKITVAVSLYDDNNINTNNLLHLQQTKNLSLKRKLLLKFQKLHIFL